MDKENIIQRKYYTHTHTHTHTEYHSAIKKNEIMSFCSKIDGPGDHHAE
jgi:hypothetical protein